MDTEICFSGYSINRDTTPPHFIENIRRELYVKPVILGQNNFAESVKEYPVFRASAKKIYLPRYYGITNYGKPKNYTLPEGEDINVEFVGTLREIQTNTISETIKAFEEHGGGLVSLDTGLGKTVVALKLICEMKKKALIIVHAQFLLEQWIERIKTFIPSARIGIIKRDICNYVDCDIVVGMLQSIISRDYPKECMKSFGLLTVDECHHIGSKTFSGIFFKIQTKYMLGLSATPERKDGLSKVIYWFLGPQIVNIKRSFNKPSIQFIFNDVSDYTEKFNRNGKVNSPIMITDLTLKESRNKIIIDLINELLKNSNRKILLLSDRRSHCELLKRELDILGISNGLYLGGMKTESRNDSVLTNVILGTYQASGEGFDVPTLDTLILSTPKSDVEQAVGRILRQKNENDPIVYDIVDSFSIFKGQYYKRKKFYNNNKFLIN